MPKKLNPDEKPIMYSRISGEIHVKETNADIHLSGLTDEVLRDMARNEAADKLWRKAAIKFLIDRKSKYANHPDFFSLYKEIIEERDAEREVEAVVESATEQPIKENSDIEFYKELVKKLTAQRDELLLALGNRAGKELDTSTPDVPEGFVTYRDTV